jgi:hypothetical protein
MSLETPLLVSRFRTDTPLDRLHDSERRPRARIPIPWSHFDGSRYPKGALEIAAQAHSALATGEYGAVAFFGRLAAAMSLHGAPFDLISAACKVPADEIRHAETVLRLASLSAGVDPTISIDRRRVEARWSGGLSLERLDVLIMEVVAVGETLATALLMGCREHARDPVARAVFASIVADEVHHARLGWYYLGWRAPKWSRPERLRVADRAGRLVADAELAFWRGHDAPRGSKRGARALGVLDSESQRAAVRWVMEDEIVPGLDALGLGASHAWRGRRRGSDRAYEKHRRRGVPVSAD